jgi:hypothetical protein
MFNNSLLHLFAKIDSLALEGSPLRRMVATAYVSVILAIFVTVTSKSFSTPLVRSATVFLDKTFLRTSQATCSLGLFGVISHVDLARSIPGASEHKEGTGR